MLNAIFRQVEQLIFSGHLQKKLTADLRFGHDFVRQAPGRNCHCQSNGSGSQHGSTTFLSVQVLTDSGESFDA